MRKIHCEEIQKEKTESIEELKEMVGFYIPEGKKWEVTLIDGGYTADTQFEAEVVSSLEQIKALLLKVLGKW